jgi:hypothetical protein
MTKDNTEFENIQNSLILLRDNIKHHTSLAGYKEILNSLDLIIDGMRLSPLSRIANYWSELTLWQKLLGGIAVSSLPLTLNIVINFSFCMTLAGLNTVIYTASGMLLAVHHEKEKINQNRLISASRDFIFFASERLDIPIENLSCENGMIANH